MTYELRDNTGSMFENDYKKGGDSLPDMRGKVMINGVTMEVAAWRKPTKDGSEFYSLKFQVPRKFAKAAKTDNFGDLDDDIPF